MEHPDDDGYKYVKGAEIPPVFYSEEKESIFRSCTFCQKELIQSNSHYFVEKAFKSYPVKGVKDIIFEYAICASCHQQMHSQLSESSRKAINNFFQENRKPQILTSEQSYDPNNYLKYCSLSNAKTQELEEYQIIGEFQGDKIILSGLPIVLSGAIMDEVQELLSPETKEELDDFMDQITDLPPDLKKLFKEDKVLII